MNASTLYFSWLLVLLSPICFGASADSPMGRVISGSAGAEAIDVSGSTRPLKRGDFIQSGEIIRTMKGATVQFRITDGSLLQLREESEFEFVTYEYDGPGGSADTAEYYLHAGGMRAITGQVGEGDQDEYLLKSDYGEVRVRGTTYECRINGALYCGVYDGAISLSNAGVTLDLGLGTDVDFGTVSSPSEPPVPLLQQPPQLANP